MTGDEYQQLAARTANPQQTTKDAINNWVWGLVGESGELVDLLKKIVYHKHYGDVDEPGFIERLHRDEPEVAAKLNKEIGDIMWYVSQLANTLGLSLDQIMMTNIEKLRQRYPDRFSTEQSIARPDTGSKA